MNRKRKENSIQETLRVRKKSQNPYGRRYARYSQIDI